MQIDPVLRAAANALLEARRHPGCLVRVTLTDPSHGSIVKCFKRVDALHEINWLLSLANNVEASRFTLELHNGSAIEIVAELST